MNRKHILLISFLALLATTYACGDGTQTHPIAKCNEKTKSFCVGETKRVFCDTATGTLTSEDCSASQKICDKDRAECVVKDSNTTCGEDFINTCDGTDKINKCVNGNVKSEPCPSETPVCKPAGNENATCVKKEETPACDDNFVPKCDGHNNIKTCVDGTEQSNPCPEETPDCKTIDGEDKCVESTTTSCEAGCENNTAITCDADGNPVSVPCQSPTPVCIMKGEIPKCVECDETSSKLSCDDQLVSITTSCKEGGILLPRPCPEFHMCSKQEGADSASCVLMSTVNVDTPEPQNLTPGSPCSPDSLPTILGCTEDKKYLTCEATEAGNIIVEKDCGEESKCTTINKFPICVSECEQDAETIDLHCPGNPDPVKECVVDDNGQPVLLEYRNYIDADGNLIPCTDDSETQTSCNLETGITTVSYIPEGIYTMSFICTKIKCPDENVPELLNPRCIQNNLLACSGTEENKVYSIQDCVGTTTDLPGFCAVVNKENTANSLLENGPQCIITCKEDGIDTLISQLGTCITEGETTKLKYCSPDNAVVPVDCEENTQCTLIPKDETQNIPESAICKEKEEETNTCDAEKHVIACDYENNALLLCENSIITPKPCNDNKCIVFENIGLCATQTEETCDNAHENNCNDDLNTIVLCIDNKISNAPCPDHLPICQREEGAAPKCIGQENPEA